MAGKRSSMNNHKTKKTEKYTQTNDTFEVHLFENFEKNAKKGEGKGQGIMDFL